MADEFQSGICSGNWWNSERIISTTTTTGGISLPFTTASSDVINIDGSTSNYGRGGGGGGGEGGGWQHEQQHHQMKAISCRSSDESGGASVTCSSSVVFQDTNNNNNQKPQESDSIGGGCGVSGNSILMDSTLQMMGYGLSSSPSMDWNPSLLNNNQSSSSGRSDHNNFGCMLQEDLTSSRRTTTTTNNIYRHHQEPGAEVLVLKDWSPKNFSSSCSTTTGDQDSSSVVNGTFQQHNIIQQGAVGFSLDHHHHHHPSNNHLLNSTTSSSECTVTCDQGLHTSFPMDSSILYGCPSSLLQGLFEPDYQSSTTPPQSVQTSFPSMTNNYFMNTNDQLSSPSWPAVIPKLPRHQFLKNTTTTSSSPPPKQIQQPSNNNNSQLHFSNNARFWNANNSMTAMNNSRPSFLSSQQIQLLTPTSYEEKPTCSNQNPLKNKADSSSAVKKSSSNEPSFKRPRVETPSPLPTFKVRKEKLGDRITALQQLVSPFGKTDTASVLFEAIEYIKFLHDQVTVLSAPYLKNGSAHIQHHQQMQNSNKTKEAQGSSTEKDLRSRGLCLVPISSTFPVTNETATDFWTPTFGGTYR